MESLTLNQIRDFAVVFLAILAFIVLLGNVIKTVKEWVSPGKNWKTEMDESMKDNTERIKKLEDGNRLIMKAMMAMLSHEINGNSIDKLQQSLGELNNYLIDNMAR